jgi:hypothetical protein
MNVVLLPGLGTTCVVDGTWDRDQRGGQSFVACGLWTIATGLAMLLDDNGS